MKIAVRLAMTTIAMMLVSGAWPVSAQQGPSTAQVFITHVSPANFPEVTLSFRVFGAGNQFTRGYSADDIALLENDTPVRNLELRAYDDAPIHVTFFIDLGYTATFNNYGQENIKKLLREFVNSDYFLDGVDTVSIVTRKHTQGENVNTTELAPTTSAEAFRRAVGTLNLAPASTESSYATYGLYGLQSALSELAAQVDTTQQATSIIYLGRMIEKPIPSEAAVVARELAEQASAQRVRLFAWHTDWTQPGTTVGPLRTFANESGGEYIHLEKDQDNLTAVRDIYDKIAGADQRARYEVVYNSIIREQFRTVSLTASGIGTAAPQSYEVAVQPPAVSIISPANNDLLERTATFDSETEQVYFDMYEVPVTAEFAWTDGYPRDIESAQLLVNGKPAGPEFVPDPSSSLLEFTWNISEFDNAGVFTNSLQVKVVDSLGFETTTSSVTQDVTVIIPQEYEGQIIVEAPDIIVETICDVEPTSMACWRERGTTYAPWIGLTVTSALAVIYRRRLGNVAVAAANTFLETEIGRQISHTLLGGRVKRRQAIAYLQVLDGPLHLQGEQISIYSNLTTLGRDPASSDKQLYRHDERSTISGKHCTLKHDRGHFQLTDDGSTNGTKVNGVLLSPGEPITLNEGDEIVLGDITEHGARLLFQVAVDAPADTPAAGNTGDTILDDDYDSIGQPVYDPERPGAAEPIFDNSLNETMVERTACNRPPYGPQQVVTRESRDAPAQQPPRVSNGHRSPSQPNRRRSERKSDFDTKWMDDLG